MSRFGAGTPTLVELFGPEWQADPYPFYRRLRERTPLFWDDALRSWVVTRYADIVALSTDPRLSEDRITPFFDRLSPARQATIRPLADALRGMMLFNDGAAHARQRGMSRSAFSRRAVDAFRASIRANTRALLDRVLERSGGGGAGEMDVIADLSAPLTRAVVADLLGIAEEDRYLLDDWASLLHEFFTQSTAQTPRLARLREIFDGMLERRRAGPTGDLVSHMLAAPPATRTTGVGAADEMFANFLLIIDAGQVTTTHLIANAVRALLDQPDQIEALRADPALLPGAAHELMRYDSSVQFTSRIARVDLDVGPVRVRAGDPVTLLIGSGNRDPEKFPDPDRVDIRRDARGQLSFGHGAHYCLGAPLALAEIEVVFDELCARTHSWAPATAELSWVESINFRFLRALPLRFEAAVYPVSSSGQPDPAPLSVETPDVHHQLIGNLQPLPR